MSDLKRPFNSTKELVGSTRLELNEIPEPDGFVESRSFEEIDLWDLKDCEEGICKKGELVINYPKASKKSEPLLSKAKQSYCADM